MKAPTFISMVASASETATRDVQTDKIIQAIKQGKWQTPVEQIRRLYAQTILRTGDREAAKKAAKLAVAPFKKQLPAILLSGRFKQRSNGALIQHSGLICADLDDLGSEALKAVRPKLLTSPYLWALFRSPTKGLKAIFRVSADPLKHLASFLAVEKHVRDLSGIQIDQSCKDLARLCFVSHDPDCYFNPDAREIDPLAEPEKPRPVIRTRSDGSKPDKEQIREMLAVIPKRPDYADWIKVVAAVGDALSDDEAIELLNEWSPEESPGEYAAKLRKRLKDIRVGTLIHLARQHGWTGQTQAPLARVDLQGGADNEPVELPPPPPPYVSPPLDLFPDDVESFIRAGAATFDVDRAFFLLPILSGAAAMIGNARSIRLKEDYIEPPIIWTANIAPTGDGKSPGLQAATAPVRMREHELIRKNQEAAKQFASDLAKWAAESKKDRGEKPPEPPLLTCWMDDTTIEAAALRLNDNPRGVALVKDEFSHWFEAMDQYHDRGGADVSRWLSIWTGNLFALDRVTGRRSYRIANPRLSITGGVVPDKFKLLLTDDFFVRGLPARILFAMPTRNRPRKWIDKSIPPEVKTEVNELFAKLVALQPHKNERGEEWPVLLFLGAEAKEIFVDFYNECARRAFEADIREAAQWAKLSAYSARLALVGQLMWDPAAREVSGNVMRAACELARWFGNEAERIYALIAETSEQRADRKLVEFIQSRGGRVRVRDVMQSYWALKNKREQTEIALNRLATAGRGEWIETKGERGPSAREFQLLPISTGLPIFPSMDPEPVDVGTLQEENAPSMVSDIKDTESDKFQLLQENEVLSEPDVSQTPPISTSTGFGDSPSKNAETCRVDTPSSQGITDFGEPKSEAVSGDLQL